MRSTPVLAFLVFLLAGLAFPAPVAAQGEAVPLLTDGTGDVHANPDGQAGPAVPLYPGADLVTLSLLETPLAFTFLVEADDLKPADQDTGADGVSYEVTFTHNGREFLLEIHRSLPAISFFVFPYLAMRDSPTAEWSYIWFDSEAATIDYAKDVITVAVPRDMLADAQGAVPYPSRTLGEMRVRASSTFSGDSISLVNGVGTDIPLTIVDDMPAPGDAAAAYDVQLGVQQDGHARLWSEAPFRSSNGEATTYVLQVEGENLAEEDDTFDIVAVGVPPQLTVVVPVPLVAIAAEESTRFPVLVTVPFGHAHGSSSKFTLEMRSNTDAASVGRLEMGVRFLAVPQPAGHHDTVYLHKPAGAESGSLLAPQAGYMNTLEDDPDAVLEGFHSVGGSYNIDATEFSWTYVLAPALEIGLDIDVLRSGAFSVPISTTTPILQASFSAELFVNEAMGLGFGGGTRTGIAFVPETAPVDLGAQSTYTFAGELVADEDGDQVPYEPGQNLLLEIRLRTIGFMPTFGVVQESPAIEPGSWFQLPVNEWHDPVDEALAAVGGPHLRAIGSQERGINPGEAVVFSVEVENPTNESLPLRFAVTGGNAAWASLPDTGFSVRAESVANFTVVVRAPADARDGERADLVVQAYPRDDPTSRGLLRLVAQVDSSQDYPDEAPLADLLGTGKDTPAPAFALLTLSLLALVGVRRRKD